MIPQISRGSRTGGLTLRAVKEPKSKPSFSCSRQTPSTELSTSSSAHSKSCDQLRCSPYLGSGDITDALSVHSAGSSSSDVEEINMSFVPESPDGQEKKVTTHAPSSGPSSHFVQQGAQKSPKLAAGLQGPSWFRLLLTLLSPTVLGVSLPVVPRDLWHQLRLQQHLLFISLYHARVYHTYPQALRLRGLQLQLLTASLQPAGGRLLHHQGQPGCGQRQHVQEHPGEL